MAKRNHLPAQAGEKEARGVVKKFRKVRKDYISKHAEHVNKWQREHPEPTRDELRFFQQGADFNLTVFNDIVNKKFGEEFVVLVLKHEDDYHREWAKIGSNFGVKKLDRFLRNRERRLVRRVATLIKKRKAKSSA